MTCPALVSSVQIPRIYWYQTDTKVIVRIMLQDVEDYFVCIGNEHLQFSTILDDVKYYVCLRLFGTVIAEDTVHSNKGREIKILLTKAHKWLNWVRLHSEAYKYPQILPDPDHLQTTDLCEASSKDPLYHDQQNNVVSSVGLNYDGQDYDKGKEDFSTFKRRNKISSIAAVVPSSSEEESDEERYDAIFE